MDYEIEELLPLVSELAQQYSGYESTSVTYEKAQMLMGAVLYCLNEYNDSNANTPVFNGISVKKQYNAGLQIVFEKVTNTRKIFNDLSLSFEDYGVKCLCETVQKGIPEFFKWYDVKFNPQNTVVTMDYPTLIDCSSLSGVDAIYKYLSFIQIEQHFLQMYDKNYVISILKKYNSQYKYMIENICDIILTNLIGHIAIKKPLTEMGFKKIEYLQLKEIWGTNSITDIENLVNSIIEKLIIQFYKNDIYMFEYLSQCSNNIAARIDAACRFNHLDNVFIL